MEKEKDTVFGVKVSSELKEKLESLFELSGFDTKKEWLESIATILTLQQAKEDGHFTKDIEELQLHTRRIVEIFSHMTQRTTHERDEESRQHEEMLLTKANMIQALSLEAQEAKAALKFAKEENNSLQHRFDVLQRQTQQYEEAMGNQAKLIESLEKQNQDLSAIVSEYKAAADENKVLHSRINEMTKQIEDSERDHERLVDSLQQKVEGLEQTKGRLQEEHRLAQEQTKANYERQVADLNKELERTREESERNITAAVATKDVEWREKVAAIREEYQVKLQNSQDEAATRFAELFKTFTKDQ